MKVNTLLTNAIYKSISDREFDPAIEGGKINVALDLFNDLVDSERHLLPFINYSEYDDLTALQATTFYDIQKMDFILNGIKFPMFNKSYRQYDDESPIENLVTIPNIYWVDEQTYQVQVYPTPISSNYKFLVWGKIAYNTLLKTDELPSTMPKAVKLYFTYALASLLADEYNAIWPQQKQVNLEKYRQEVLNLNNEDLSPINDVMFAGGASKGYAPFPAYFYASGGGQ